MICPACKEDADLYPVEFSLIPGWRGFKCQSCIDNNIEPRFTVVLASLTRQDTPYLEAIMNYNYVGPPITVVESSPRD